MHGFPLRDAPPWAGLLAICAARPRRARRRAAPRRPRLAAGVGARSLGGLLRGRDRRRVRPRDGPRAGRAPAWRAPSGSSPASPRATGSRAASGDASAARTSVLEGMVRARTAELRETQLEIVQPARAGGRVARRRHRPPHRADEPHVRGARAGGRHERGRGRGAPARQRAARRGQDRHPRRRPPEAGAARRRRDRDDAPAHGHRRVDPRRLVVAADPTRRGDRADASRALGRNRLPGGPRGRGDPALRAGSRPSATSSTRSSPRDRTRRAGPSRPRSSRSRTSAVPISTPVSSGSSSPWRPRWPRS